MKLAVLKGNRFNPWHLLAFNQLPGAPEVTAFRAESEIQQYFVQRGDSALNLPIERIYFDTQAGPFLRRAWNEFATRYLGREPRILPFHDRLQGYDLIQSWELFTDWSSEAVEAHRKWDIPLSVMVWDNIPFNMERNPARRTMKERVAANADLFIVHTERSRRMLDVEGVHQDRVVKIDPGVDTGRFSPGRGHRERFGLPEDAFVVLFVGWLLPRKGLDFLLLALRELIHDPRFRDQNLRLLVVGSGPGRDRIERLIDRLDVRNICVLAGSLPYAEMPEAFRAADVFVLPSIATPEWQEQFGMSLIEAMACGIPVISTFSGAIPEIVERAAILCQPNDFVSLYEALRDLLSDSGKRQALAEQGRMHALARFRLEKYAEALGSVYARLVGG